MATRMQQRRGTAAEWAAQNPVLGDGELGFETDTKIIKVGDGLTAYNDLTLPYVSSGGGTMTGPLSLVVPTQSAHGARKVDLDNAVSTLNTSVSAINNVLAGFREFLAYSSSATFNKGDYPWLKFIFIRCLGGGGKGGDALATGAGEASMGGGGGSGSYSESFRPVAELSESIAVTVGLGGTGAFGGDSSFGAYCIARGGAAGEPRPASAVAYGVRGGAGGLRGTGNPTYPGADGGLGWGDGQLGISGSGGSSALGGAPMGIRSATAAQSAAGTDAQSSSGAGGSGAINSSGIGTTTPGGDGGSGRVTLELYG